MVTFVQIRSDAQDLNRVQQNITNAVNALQSTMLGNSTSIVEDVFLNVDYTAVPHGLGRPPVGFWVLSQNVPEQITTGTTTKPVAPSSPNPNLYIMLTTNGGPCTATLLFF